MTYFLTENYLQRKIILQLSKNKVMPIVLFIQYPQLQVVLEYYYPVCLPSHSMDLQDFSSQSSVRCLSLNWIYSQFQSCLFVYSQILELFVCMKYIFAGILLISLLTYKVDQPQCCNDQMSICSNKIDYSREIAFCNRYLPKYNVTFRSKTQLWFRKRKFLGSFFVGF